MDSWSPGLTLSTRPARTAKEHRASGPGMRNGTGVRTTMRDLMDAFQHAVDEARRQLIRDAGQNVAVRELIRRAGFAVSRRASVARHLNPPQPWPKGHKVPPDIV